MSAARDGSRICSVRAGRAGRILTQRSFVIAGFVIRAVSASIQPGQTDNLTVTFQKGSYELWCSVDEHKDLGMDLRITVG